MLYLRCSFLFQYFFVHFFANCVYVFFQTQVKSIYLSSSLLFSNEYGDISQKDVFFQR